MLSVCFSSCRKKIDTTIPLFIETTQQIKASSIAESGVFDEGFVATEIAKFAKREGFNLNKITYASLRNCEITIVDNAIKPIDIKNFNELNIDFYTDRLSTVNVASKTIAAETGFVLGLKPTLNQDVKEYIRANDLGIKLYGSTNAPILHSVKVKIKIELALDVILFD
jgi:hypothetical protein